jgi:hypothetical protein
MSAPRPLFAQLLGEAFERLPAVVANLHLRPGTTRYRGEVDVVRGTHPLARLCAWATRLPPSGHGPIQVEIVSDGGRERWTRFVAGHAMRSRLWAADGLLWECLGLATFAFRLSVEHGEMLWRVERFRTLGIVPLPVRWFSGVQARESVQSTADGDRYHFDVRAALPLIGLLVHYRGWLDAP